LPEHIEVKLCDDTVWLTLNQIAQLFNRDKSVISRHLSNIYKEGELSQESTVAKNATVQIEAGRKVQRDIDYYNLDAIISLGYRVVGFEPQESLQIVAPFAPEYTKY